MVCTNQRLVSMGNALFYLADPNKRSQQSFLRLDYCRPQPCSTPQGVRTVGNWIHGMKGGLGPIIHHCLDAKLHLQDRSNI